QRMLSMTENAMPTESVQADSPWFEKLIEKRLAVTPEAPPKEAIVGQAPPIPELLVPMHPAMNKSLQYQHPLAHVKRVLESYARHVVQIHAVQFPDRTYHSVRIYRVVHRIPPKALFFLGVDP